MSDNVTLRSRSMAEFARATMERAHDALDCPPECKCSDWLDKDVGNKKSFVHHLHETISMVLKANGQSFYTYESSGCNGILTSELIRQLNGELSNRMLFKFFFSRKNEEGIILLSTPDNVLAGIKIGAPLTEIYSDTLPIQWTTDIPMAYVNTNDRIRSFQQVVCDTLTQGPIKDNLGLFLRFIQNPEVVRYFMSNCYGIRMLFLFERSQKNNTHITARRDEKHPRSLQPSDSESESDGYLTDVDDCLLTNYEDPKTRDSRNMSTKQIQEDSEAEGNSDEDNSDAPTEECEHKEDGDNDEHTEKIDEETAETEQEVGEKDENQIKDVTTTQGQKRKQEGSQDVRTSTKNNPNPVVAKKHKSVHFVN